MRHLVRVAVAVCAAALGASDAAATTALKMPNDLLAATADLVVIGTATDVRSAWEGRMLVTVVTVRVDETVKGTPGDTVSVTLPGGIDANRRVPVAMTVAGAPRIARGEHVFLFLEHDPQIQSGYTVVGFSQGKFSIAADAGGRQVVTRDLSQVLLATGAGVSPGTRSLVRLDDFRREIAGYVR
jgi:hypothetical protein